MGGQYSLYPAPRNDAATLAAAAAAGGAAAAASSSGAGASGSLIPIQVASIANEGNPISMQVMSSDTVGHLMSVLESQHKLRPKALIFNGQALDTKQTLGNYQVSKGSMIRVLEKK